MVLSAGINKATGLAAALSYMNESPAATVAIGDAENDHALLELCAVGAAVSNALPLLRQRADLVTAGARGDGVIELINRILDNDLADVTPRPREPQPVATLTA